MAETEELFTCLNDVERRSQAEAEKQKAKQKALNEKKMENKRLLRLDMAGGLITRLTEQIQRWENY